MASYTNDTLIPSNSIITDKRKIEWIHRSLAESWDEPELTMNFCPLPISLERKHLPYLKQNVDNYTASEKSNGVRYTIVLGRYDDGEPYSVALNRKLVIYEIAVAANQEMFNGTEIDGELVWEYYSKVHPPRQLFFIFDIPRVRGISWRFNTTLLERLGIINDIFHIPHNDLQFTPKQWEQQAEEYAANNKIVCLGNMHNIAFVAKAHGPARNIDVLVRTAKNLHHASDGILLTPINESIRKGRHKTMFKWKSHHTIDVNLDLTRTSITDLKWSINVFAYHQGHIVPCDEYLVYEDQPVQLQVIRGKFLRSLLAHLETKQVTNHIVLVEALLTRTGTTWSIEPKLLRRDKSVPNAISTIQRTFVNVAEAITIEELIEVLTT